ncbi:hypothetical protein KDW46_02190 [Burkholderia vietnamiensis]|nr:hypothetical protein [Burkholderia vietnamiensis]
MRALAAKLRDEYDARIRITSSRYRDVISKLPLQAANAIDALLAEVEAIEQAILDPENQPSQYGTVLLEAAAADKRRLDSGCILTHERDEFGQEYECERRGLDLRERIDAALAQRQGEGS